MFCLFLTPSLAALTIDAFSFPVEELTRNGSGLVKRFDNESLYFNYLGPAPVPSECTSTSDTVAIVIAEDAEGHSKCYQLGPLNTVKHTLIMDKPYGLPKGLRTTYDSERKWGGVLVFEILCSRVEKRSIQRYSMFDYRVTWYHPSGCPRPNIMKPSRFAGI